MDALAIAVDAVTEYLQPEFLLPIRRTPSALCVHWDVDDVDGEPVDFAHTGVCHYNLTTACPTG